MIKNIVLLGLNGRGGTLHYSSSISSALAELANVSLLLPSYSNTSLISKKVKLIRTTAPPSAIKTILLTFNIFQHIKAIRDINRKKPDVINILDIHPWYVMYWPFLKAKKIVTINDPELHSGEAGLVETFILKLITKFLLSNAHKIIVLGKKQEHTVRRLGYKQNIIVSRIGHYGFFTAKSSKKFRTEPKTLLFFGRIREYKGLKYLLNALIELDKKGNDFKLIIAGEGDMISYSGQLSKISEKVEVHNEYIPDEKANEYFQRCSFVVMPYTDATQTGVIQVTYSFKKPIIATKVGSLPELVVDGKTGFLVEPKNTKQLIEKILFFLKDPSKASTYGENANKWMKKELDWEKIAKHLLKNI